MRMAESRAGRAALGAAAAAGRAGTWRTASSSATTPRDAVGDLRAMWRDGVAASLDLLGEATVTAAEADRYAERCAEALDELAARVREGGPSAPLERDSSGRCRARTCR